MNVMLRLSRVWVFPERMKVVYSDPVARWAEDRAVDRGAADHLLAAEDLAVEDPAVAGLREA